MIAATVAVWLSEGSDEGAPAWAQTMVSVVVIAFLVVTVPVGWLGFPRFLVPPSLRTREGRMAHHLATIHDVRPEPGHEDELEPYFIAMCSCDWVGEARQDELAARRDAEKHTPNVAAGLERPLA